MKGIDVLFVAGFGPIVRDAEAAKKLYKHVLGLPLDGEDYLNTNKVDGVKEFGVWLLSGAAESCFGIKEWPTEIPAPQAWLEFDVADIEAATRELEAQGYRLLVSARKEPWGQTVTRFLSPEGMLLGATHTPWLRGEGERP